MSLRRLPPRPWRLGSSLLSQCRSQTSLCVGSLPGPVSGKRCSSLWGWCFSANGAAAAPSGSPRPAGCHPIGRWPQALPSPTAASTADQLVRMGMVRGTTSSPCRRLDRQRARTADSRSPQSRPNPRPRAALCRSFGRSLRSWRRLPSWHRCRARTSRGRAPWGCARDVIARNERRSKAEEN